MLPAGSDDAEGSNSVVFPCLLNGNLIADLFTGWTQINLTSGFMRYCVNRFL